MLDDPVTSMDHQRKARIARRLVSEGKERQVIVFTHDLVFLSMLGAASDEKHVEMHTHWIQRDSEGRPGQVSLNESPAATPHYRSTLKAQETLKEANAASGSVRERLLQRGMGELRRTVEEIVPHFLLKQVVTRWNDRIIVTALKKVNWDHDLVTDVVNTYDKLSAYIEGHSHTEEHMGAPIEPKHLIQMTGEVDDLIKRARPDRKI